MSLTQRPKQESPPAPEGLSLGVTPTQSAERGKSQSFREKEKK